LSTTQDCWCRQVEAAPAATLYIASLFLLLLLFLLLHDFAVSTFFITSLLAIMTPTLLQTWFGLSALAGVILDVTSAAAEPRVFGLDFAKHTVRNVPEARQDRLRRRQKTLAVNIDNAEIAYTSSHPCTVKSLLTPMLQLHNQHDYWHSSAAIQRATRHGKL